MSPKLFTPLFAIFVLSHSIVLAQETSTISGKVWQDTDGDGEQRNDEPGLPGVTIYLDINLNGTFDAEEPRTRSLEDNPLTRVDESGLYRIETRHEGRAAVRQIVPRGFQQTFPRTPHIIVIDLERPIVGLDFGNRNSSSIHGRKWEDRNGDGEQDSNEPGLAGVTIYSDLNRNGKLDEGEPHTISMEDDPDTKANETGHYWLENLDPGRHTIREVVPEGFVQTFPPQFLLEPNGHSDVSPVSLHLVLDAGETETHSISWTFHPFCVRPFMVDVIAPDAPASMVTNLSGIQINGCGGDESEFDVRLMGDGNNHSFDIQFVDSEFGGILATLPVQIETSSSGREHEVPLDPGETVDGIDFGNQRKGSVHGIKWEDRNGNGERDEGEPGLPGVIIYSDLNNNGIKDNFEPFAISMRDDPNTAFNEAGHYWLENLIPGAHTIREVIPDGFIQTFPTPILPILKGLSEVSPASLVLTLANGQIQVEEVSWTFDPFCFRPFHVNVRAPAAPVGMVTNLSGINLNGCGGDTSEFDVRFIGDGDSHSFDLEFVDDEFGGILATIPIQINSPNTSEGHEIRVPSGEAIEGIDFGNQPKSDQSVHGQKWLDLDGDGTRDRNEPGLPGVVIYSDLNNNNALDRREPAVRTMRDDPNTAFDESGMYWLEGLEPGEHIIREIVPDGFRQTFPQNSFHEVKLEQGQSIEGVDFGNQREEPSSIHGRKWLDRNGNGEQDPNEPGLAGVVIYSDLNNNRQFDPGEPATRTMRDNPDTDFDEAGMYWLESLPPGEHLIREIVPDGFVQTFPPNLVHSVELEPNQSIDGIDFGNRGERPTGVQGSKWLDRNKNGERDPNEPGLPGVIIYSDRNNNGRFDPEEPATRTIADHPETDFDESGLYWLLDLEPGQHHIREIVPEGFIQTYPTTQSHSILLRSEQVIEGLNFGNTIETERGEVHGRKWLDRNGNGERDPNEPGLPGVVIYSDLNNNGRLDSDEPAVRSMRDDTNTTIDESGMYWLMGLQNGTHNIREIVPDGFVQTFPAEAHRVEVVSGSKIEGIHFGNQPASESGDIRGLKWLDINGNGERDEGEPGLPGVIIYSDLNANGVFDAGEPATRSQIDDPNTANDEKGQIWFTGLQPGRHLIREVIPDGFSQTFPSQQQHFVIVEEGTTIENIDFGNKRKDENGEIHGIKWLDENEDGQRDPDEPGLPGVLIYVDRNNNESFDIGEPVTRTMPDDPVTDFDESGMYWFVELPPGQHIIREVIPDGFAQTFPSAGAHRVELVPDSIVEGIDFGNFRLENTNTNGEVHGTKWLDRNGNGTRETDEPGLPGVIIFADLNNNGEYDDREPATRSMEDDPVTDFDEAGMYWLTSLAPGQYVIREVIPEGFVQTFPLENGHDIDLEPNSIVEGIDFGNRRSVTEDPNQVPGDCNQDGIVDISDVLCVIGHLFVGNPSDLPCGDGSTTHTSNVRLLDFNGDQVIDLSDGIAEIMYLFLGEAEHVLGTDCIYIDQCLPVCSAN